MKTFIRFLRVIALLAAALGVWRMFVSRPSAGEPDIQPWNPMPAPRPAPRLSVVPEPVIDLTIEEARWAEPVDGDVVPGYPVKGKVGSGIYHMPGGLSYARTIPDRCYATPQDAEADGLRPAKR